MGDPVAGLRAAVEAVHRLPDDPDAVLVSGDLADNAADGEYELRVSCSRSSARRLTSCRETTTTVTRSAGTSTCPGRGERRCSTRWI
jgi:3',5'-cyclic AMP phosphodiesterase CpdA